MMHPITKYTRQSSSGANIPPRVREAFRRAEDEHPGAIHLELPEDIARNYRAHQPDTVLLDTALASMGAGDIGLSYGNPDFVQYARSYGAHGHRFESASELAPLLQTCFGEPGAHVVDVPVDYSDNDRIPRRLPD
jgi:thiamine pyrophosphate-dependent acetolactate synthase large subunit-like protein